MKYKLLSYTRYAIQILSLFTFIFLFTYLVYPVDEPASILEWFSHFDPWMLLGQLRFEYVFPSWSWLPILIIVVTLLVGRFFCGWLCPFGAFMTLADILGSKLIFKHTALKKWAKFRQNIIIKLLPIRYLWLCLLLILFICGLNSASSLTPFALFSHEIVRIFLGTVPWILIFIFIVTVVLGRIWCTIFCPTGVLFSLLSKLRLFRYETNGNCVHCNKCINHCPVGAAPNEKGVGERCIICGECASVCPTKTLSFKINNFLSNGKNKKSKIKIQDNTGKQNQFTRRQFLKIAGVFIVGILIWIWGKASRMYKKVLRPPGALYESEFKAVCNRCGRCVEVCPNNALKYMPLSDGIDAFETPYIIAREANCSLCLACQEVCPTGAIAKIPVENVNMGKATIDKSRCLAWSQGKDCFICGEQCLRVAINLEGENKPVVQTDLCVGCGTCERNCPVEGIAAIQVTPR